MLEARNIAVTLGHRQILNGVGIDARPGALTAIVGPNGSGKTTLLKALTGELACAGNVRLSGREISQMKPWELAGQRAVLQQSATMAFPFTVREVVELGLSGGFKGRRPQHDAALVESALAMVDLAGFEGRFYQQLSGGEQQRTQLARVLAQVWDPIEDGQARWLFLDEPVSSLDIRHQLQIMGTARDFAERGGGVIAILHDLNLTAMFADHVVMMHGGRVQKAGPPGDVLKDDLLAEVFGCRLRVGATPPAGTAFVLPHSATDSMPAVRPA